MLAKVCLPMINRKKASSSDVPRAPPLGAMQFSVATAHPSSSLRNAHDGVEVLEDQSVSLDMSPHRPCLFSSGSLVKRPTGRKQCGMEVEIPEN